MRKDVCMFSGGLLLESTGRAALLEGVVLGLFERLKPQ